MRRIRRMLFEMIPDLPSLIFRLRSSLSQQGSVPHISQLPIQVEPFWNPSKDGNFLWDWRVERTLPKRMWMNAQVPGTFWRAFNWTDKPCTVLFASWSCWQFVIQDRMSRNFRWKSICSIQFLINKVINYKWKALICSSNFGVTLRW